MDGEMRNGKPVLKAEKPTPEQLEIAQLKVANWQTRVQLLETQGALINVEHPKAVTELETAKAALATLETLAKQ